MLRLLLSYLRPKRTESPSDFASPVRTEELRLGSRMIDVEGMIRQASTRVSVDQLVKKGKKFIHVLSREKINELINRSVTTIVDKHRITAAHRHAVSATQIEAESGRSSRNFFSNTSRRPTPRPPSSDPNKRWSRNCRRSASR